MRTIGVCMQMRMPFFSYFIVVGLALTLGLLFISDRIEPLGSPVPTSQIVGIGKPFKPEPERSPYKITGTNFAAVHKPASALAGRCCRDDSARRTGFGSSAVRADAGLYAAAKFVPVML